MFYVLRLYKRIDNIRLIEYIYRMSNVANFKFVFLKKSLMI